MPTASNHGIPLIYFSRKRENVLVYLSNAIEKYCRDTGFSYEGQWEKWGPYGFTKDGRLCLEEYYQNALESTYKGVPGYIYCAENITDSGFEEIFRTRQRAAFPFLYPEWNMFPTLMRQFFRQRKAA